MGNQGYSHEATRVAAEIIWSGEIGDVTEVHSFRGRASWPQGMQTLPAPEKVPDTLDWDLWLGGAAMRPYTSGDEAYRKEYNQQQFGFYLPFNWRGFYDFGSSLIGDWGIHQLGPANLALRLGSPISVECLKLGEGRSPYTFPRGGVVIKWEFAARENMPPVTVYWSDTGDMYTPPGMTVEQMRAIPGTGPEIEGRRRARRRRWRRGAAAAPGARGAGAARSRRRRGGGRGRGGRGGGGGSSRAAATTPCSSAPRAILGTGGRGEERRPAAGIALGGVQAAAAHADAVARPSARLGPRVQGRRAGVLATSASPVRTPSGWCSAPSRRASKASCCGIRRRWSSRTTARRTSS